MLLELTNIFSKVEGYNTNNFKKTPFLYTNNKHAEENKLKQYH